MERRFLKLMAGGLLGLAATLAVGLGSAPAATAQDDEPLDSSVCAACHDDQVAAFTSNPHSLLNDPDWGAAGVEGGSCVSCHAGAAAHVDEGGGEGNIFAFGDDASPAARSQACQECHADTHPRFRGSEHAQAGVTCTTCHQIHQPGHSAVSLLRSGPMTATDPAEAIGAASSVCASCHGDVFARFQWNERHRLQEGILACTSCHDPHERATRARLGGFKQDACMECHTDKGGPFIFEHASARAEGCVACHDPHGSPNRHMLAFQGVAELCFSCHATVPGFHSRFNLDTVCTNCHTSIHGSNFDPFFLK
ncbi:MAG TPA: cytochrome c3 family protein [Thermoanaerobaculia bacterium]|nr:cytochrome c3 family protein [Thermoanaerobaculia bacterium]